MNNQYVALLVAVAIGAAIVFSGSLHKFPVNTSPPVVGIPVTPAPHTDKNLQLQTFGFTVQPTPSQTCALEGAKENCECQHIPDNPDIKEIVCSKTNNCELWQICEQMNWPPDFPPIQKTTLGGVPLKDSLGRPLAYGLRCQWLRNTLADGREYCVAKPVVYLYPETPTYVDVSVTTTGKIVVSDPLYPAGGWKSVFAKPDGTLVYKNRTYSELFYESNVKDIKKPANGLVFETANLDEELSRALSKIGLNNNEKKEFLDYWIPNLKRLNSAYILFSLIDPNEKERIDKVNITPEPDTRIEFIAYFKPLDKMVELPELKLGPTPQRNGFTLVEWGGTIDLNKNN